MGKVHIDESEKVFDDAHIKSLNVRARVNMVARRLHPMPSSKPRPIDGLEWAMRPESKSQQQLLAPLSALQHLRYHPAVPHPQQQGLHFMASALQHL